MSDELKPCPFCGGEASIRIDTSHSTACLIGCATMGCFGHEQWEETEAEAIAAWNHRPLVQQAIAAERGEPVAVPHVVYDMKMPPYHYQKPYTGSGGSISVPSAPPTEAQIRADERERCAKVAEGYVGSTPPRYESGIERRATTSQQADNCLNAIKVRAATIAAAIRSLKEADNGAGNECICPKCGLRHGGKVDSGAVF